MTERTFRPYDRDQMLLLPPSLKEWLPEGHLSGFVSDVVDTLDLSEIFSYYGGPARGTVPFNPRMLTAIIIYAYCVGVFSSRRIARKLEENVAFRVLAANQHPDFRTISDFRKVHLKALSGLFKQVFKLRTRKGRAIYVMRKEIVEPVFGQIKQARGFRQFLLRGVEQVKGEWSLVCTTHNILKLWKSGQFKSVCAGI